MNKDVKTCGEGGLCRRWWLFSKERFPLATHVPMILVFTLANAGVSARLTGGDLNPLAAAASYLVALLFFFRLRCFDEIKDYQVDCELNPTRPLARGLLELGQVKLMCVALAVIELLIASSLGRGALLTHAVAVAYSFLMYKEFFIGKWLRPHLTTYAVTHTFVSMLMGWSIGAMVAGLGVWRMPVSLLRYGAVNWMLFNVFEFARKTFAPGEETPGADSYSLRFGAKGAVALCLSQIVIAVLLIAWVPAGTLTTHCACRAWIPHVALALLPVVGAAVYLLRRTVSSARLYRGLSMAYQFLFYGLVAVQSLMR